MTRLSVEDRVTHLEELMAQLLATVERVDRQLDRTDRQIENTQRQIENTQRHVDQLSLEMREFKEESRRTTIEMRHQWGALSNKMGTMAEDLVAPSIGRILRATVGCPDGAVDSVAVRVRRLHPQTRDEREFDVVATCGEYLLINETKSKLGSEEVKEFVDRLPQARAFFPEYGDRTLIGAIASLYVAPEVVRYGERLGLIVLGFGQDVMEVLNSPEFTPKAF